MPSRLIQEAPSPTPSTRYNHTRAVAAASSTAAAFSLLLFLVVCFRKITRKRTAPEADSAAAAKPPHRLPYSALRRATDSFSPSRRLGQGGFGPVFRGTPLNPKSPAAPEIAVKVMDSGSLQGEREFQNELLFAAVLDSAHVVSLLGFSSDRKRRRMLLVYEFMPNGNLQDALLHRKCPELMDWKKRFAIVVDIARGLEYLHGLDQPIIHGDIKPSNILLDRYFSAKIGDFGLARLKLDNPVEASVEGGSNGGGGGAAEDYGSVVEETESVTTVFEESNVGFDLSPEGFAKAAASSPELAAVAMASPASNSGLAESPEVLEKLSATPSPETSNSEQSAKKDWWLKQENGGVKDYVREWIGTEIKSERPKSEWIGTATDSAAAAAAGNSSNNGYNPGKVDKKVKKKSKKQLDWWISMDNDEEKNAKSGKKEKRRPAREWWREEYCEELAKKKKKKMKQQKGGSDLENGDGDWWPQDDEMYSERRKKNKSRSRSRSRSSLDWWLEGLSGELRRPRRNGSHDSASGDIPRSGGGYSSTPSMRGTVCYVAPETGFGANPSEKCDVYSFGVTLLVLIAGRRPLQVTSSPMSEYQRANLLSWARHLARAGKLLELVDKNVQALDQEQAVLCITVALLCLQKIPARRPSMKEVVALLTGESGRPELPTDLSPSPQSRFPFKSHKRVVR